MNRNPTSNRMLQRMLMQHLRKRPWLGFLLVVLVGGYVLLRPTIEQRTGWDLPDLTSKEAVSSGTDASPVPRQSAEDAGEQAILDAFRTAQSDVMVRSAATIVKLLPDDNDGSRHQKMILRLPSGHTLLLAHNIDLAERVPADEGDQLEFYGEYEYTEKGGVIHWTHHDPRGRHPDGWLRHQGQEYR